MFGLCYIVCPCGQGQLKCLVFVMLSAYVGIKTVVCPSGCRQLICIVVCPSGHRQLILSYFVTSCFVLSKLFPQVAKLPVWILLKHIVVLLLLLSINITLHCAGETISGLITVLHSVLLQLVSFRVK
jgi:hypothetical protein